MDDVQLKELWNSYERQIEASRILNMQSWVLNMKCFEELQKQKAGARLNRLITIKTVAVVLGIIWVLLLGFLVVHSLVLSKIFFVISLSMIMLFTTIAIVIYIKHIVLIRQINNSESIVETQERLATLQLSTINVTRILFLQAPFYCTWFISPEWLRNDWQSVVFITLPIALLFTLASLWLFRNIRYENKDKRWFKILFNSPEWTYVLKAQEFINDIEEFRREA
ncbi:MAG: hypothetical protein J0I41_11835 [Filimonas sp.]|nr:hypothetical protein [Filimonas sp.]